MCFVFYLLCVWGGGGGGGGQEDLDDGGVVGRGDYDTHTTHAFEQ